MRRLRSRYLGFPLAVLLAVCWPGGLVMAEDITFSVTWSGAALGNSATATGLITFDSNILQNPGANSQTDVPFVTNFSITVSNAASGNGTFVFSDFGDFVWDTAGATLDFNLDLVGQSTPSGFPWGETGHNGQNGDFNIFESSGNGAPTGTFYFELTTNQGEGDTMFLTSMTLVAVPEPGTIALLGITGAGITGCYWRRKRRLAKALAC